MTYYPDQSNKNKFITKFIDYGMENSVPYYYGEGYDEGTNFEEIFPTDISNIPYNIGGYYGARSKRFFDKVPVTDQHFYWSQDDIPDDYEGNNSIGLFNWGEIPKFSGSYKLTKSKRKNSQKSK